MIWHSAVMTLRDRTTDYIDFGLFSPRLSKPFVVSGLGEITNTTHHGHLHPLPT